MANKFWTELNDQQAELVSGGIGFNEKLEAGVFNKQTGELLTIINVASLDLDTPRNPNSITFVNGGNQPFGPIPPSP